MMDIIEEHKMSYDEKYKLLRKATNDKFVLELRRKTFGTKYYTVIAGFAGKAFLTNYFANRYFNKLTKKHNLKIINN